MSRSVCPAAVDAFVLPRSDVLSDLFLLLLTDPPTQQQVNVTVDYIRAATGPAEGTPAFSERTCATVTIGGM